MSKEDNGVIIIYILTIIKNAISMICFTILAIAFNKWWLSLFSILFWSSFELANKDSDVK